MSTNLGTGPMNLVQEIVFIRLYTRVFRNGILETKVGGQGWQIFSPSDETQSFLYSYRSWLYERKPRELARKEIPGLYPIPSLSDFICEYLCEFYCNARWCDADRESWARLVAKVAGAHSLVDSKVTLTQAEASWVNKRDVWSGAIEIDPDVDERILSVVPHEITMRSDITISDMTDNGTAQHTVQIGKEMSEECEYGLVECVQALKVNDLDKDRALRWLRRGRR